MEYNYDQQWPYVQIHKRPYINSLKKAFNSCKSKGNKQGFSAEKECIYNKKKRYDFNIWQEIKSKFRGFQYCESEIPIYATSFTDNTFLRITLKLKGIFIPIIYRL